MFGGFNGSTYLNDTWTFNGATWTQVDTPIAPSAFLFGGQFGNAQMSDTWELAP
jgi:hypothetical protein